MFVLETPLKYEVYPPKGREKIFFFKMYGILIGMFIYCSQYCIVKVHAKIWILRADAKNQYDRNAKSSCF